MIWILEFRGKTQTFERLYLINLICLCIVSPGSYEFNIEVHHGGFFVGFGHLRSYMGEKIDWSDRIETDTWSPLWFENFV